MIRVLIEENNAKSANLMKGIADYAKKKRDELAIVYSVSDLPPCGVVIVLGASLTWTQETVRLLNERGVHPVLDGVRVFSSVYDYSCVSPTYTRTVYEMSKYFLQKGASSVAFIGFNQDSLPDRLKLKGAKEAAIERNACFNVYENEGNVIACVERLKRSGAKEELFICVNDFVAVVLQQRCGDLLKGKTLCSCSKMRISDFVKTPFISCLRDDRKTGFQLGELYGFLKKSEAARSVDCMSEMKIVGLENVSFEPQKEEWFRHDAVAVDFYGDEKISEVQQIERALCACDQTDIQIIKALLSGATFEEIAEKLFLAEGTVKYRVKALIKNACVSSRKELLELFNRYELSF